MFRAVPEHGGDGGGRSVVGVVVDHYVFPEPVHVAAKARTPQPGEAAGGVLEGEAEGEGTPYGSQQRLHQVRPEHWRPDLGRLAAHRDDEAEALVTALDPG